MSSIIIIGVLAFALGLMIYAAPAKVGSGDTKYNRKR